MKKGYLVLQNGQVFEGFRFGAEIDTVGELVKVDLRLNGEGVDALSFIAHKDKAYPRARKLCEKLKENIPRQLFEVPV